jgi:hypothetical protein
VPSSGNIGAAEAVDQTFLGVIKPLSIGPFLFCWVIGGIYEDYTGEALPY